MAFWSEFSSAYAAQVHSLCASVTAVYANHQQVAQIAKDHTSPPVLLLISSKCSLTYMMCASSSPSPYQTRGPYAQTLCMNPEQGHSDFLIKVYGFPDLLSWSFPGVFSVLWLANNYRPTSLPPRSGEFRSSDLHSGGNLRRGHHWRTGGFPGNSWFSCISLRVLIGEKARVFLIFFL